MHDAQPVLETERLHLRPFTLDDAPIVQELAGKFEVADTTLNIPHPYADGMAEEWIKTHPLDLKQMAQITYAIVLKETDTLIGAISLRPQRHASRAEMGYWIGHPYWGQGYATEAGKVIIRYGFLNLNLHRIFAEHFSRNPASGRVMRKMGMTYEGCMRDHMKKGDRYEDAVVYGILRDDWQE